MGELKLYSVSDRYIEYLRKTHEHVFSNKIGERTHTRKYVGVALEMRGFHYFIPLSSPKASDYIQVGEKRSIRKSIIPIIRMVSNEGGGDSKLLGTIKISNMIPVPPSELIPYELNAEPDMNYRNLVIKEIEFIRKNSGLIQKNAKILYTQKAIGEQTARYIASTLDFASLESLCTQFILTESAVPAENS